MLKISLSEKDATKALNKMDEVLKRGRDYMLFSRQFLNF